jgi:Zn-dependent peptidase ImmA (M78 family)
MAKIIIDTNNGCIEWLIKAYPGITDKIAIKSWLEKKPTLANVRSLSNAVRRPIAFFLSNPQIKPESVGGIDKLDTRTIKSEKIDINYKVVVLSEELQKRRQSYIYVATATEIDLLPKFLTFNENDQRGLVDYISATIYPPQERLHTLDKRGLYEYLVSKIEELNILIFKMPAKDKNLRGLALYHDILPIIGIASNDVLVGQIFSIIHELAHVLLKSSMIHNLDTAQYEHSRIERLCNDIAGKVLLQDSYIFNDPIITKLIQKNVTLDDIEEIAEKYNISRNVVLIRLLRSKVITQDVYTTLDGELSEKRKTEPKNKSSGGGKDTHLYTTINQLGQKYCKAIYTGYTHNVISKNDLHYYLGRKDKYCLKIMSKIALKMKK